MSAELVSIVIPVYNGARFLADAIESALEQTYRPVEVIVVDDGSTDDTAEVIDRFAAVRSVRQDNAGPSAARNRGMSLAAGSLLTFCDSDDRYRPSKVDVQVQHLREHPDVGCVLVGHETFYEAGVARAKWEQDEGGTQPQSVMARRSVFDVVGGFDPSYRFAEGIEWLGRVRSAGIAIDTIDGSYVDRRIHGANLSYERAGMQQNLLRVMRERIAHERARP